MWSIEEIEVRHSEVKPVKNMNKKPKSFLKISPMQKEVLLPTKMEDHAYE